MWQTIRELKTEARAHARAVIQWEAIRAALPERAHSGSPGLTICSVAFHAKRYLDLNHRLIRDLNPDAGPWEWLLFDNNLDPAEMVDETDGRFTVVRPGRRETILGYEHALGISALLSRVRTRFLLVLDPDCFIVSPDWLRRVPAYMVGRQLGFFGTPINPRRHNSYRYFPYMVCMFVDLARVSPRELCFLPAVWQLNRNVTYRIRKAFAGVPKAGVFFRWLLTEQWRTNGWLLKTRYGDGRTVKFECVQPVWDIEAEMSRAPLKRIIHRLTPAAVSSTPKQPHYCSTRGFRLMGAPDVCGLGWEEFVWNDHPFAFHIGSVHAAGGVHVPTLSRIADTFADGARGQDAGVPVAQRHGQ